MSLRARCEDIYFKLTGVSANKRSIQCMDVDVLEAFAREIRNEGLEEAAKIADDLFDKQMCQYTSQDIRGLSTSSAKE